MPAAAIERCGSGDLARRLRGLYAITPDAGDTDALVAKVAAALRGGACAIQYRNKSASEDLRQRQALALVQQCRVHGALFIVNDDPRLAASVQADGVHVGEHDGGVEAARAILGGDALVGVSCYDDFDLAQRAVGEGADYVAFGSFFASRVKPGARHATLDLLARSRALGVPVVAIGGIDAGNAAALFRAGADAVAVITAVFAHATTAEVEQAAAMLARTAEPNDPLHFRAYR